MKGKEYNKQLKLLQVELDGLGRWLQESGKRVVVLFEGRDTAGKGGAINAIAQRMNPRQCHVVALPKPNDRERGQWYFQRYVSHLPTAGEIVLFDRSWYNRAGVERVMGYCTDDEYSRFLQQAPAFEKMLVDDGILLFKYWLTVNQAQQEERFAERAVDPLKRWKLSPIDLVARQQFVEYGDARAVMLEHTHTAHAPWTLVNFNEQKHGRLTLISHLLGNVPHQRVPAEPLELPPLPGKPKKERFQAGLKPIG